VHARTVDHAHIQSLTSVCLFPLFVDNLVVIGFPNQIDETPRLMALLTHLNKQIGIKQIEA
jgi:hypothetical protein